MDINRVRPGAILICPVKVPGGGVYIGDAHALQGNGEIAGHTCDVCATVTLQVNVIKVLGNEVKNRCTITGSIDIGRAPGVITATLLVPKEKLAEVGLLEYAIEQYGE